MNSTSADVATTPDPLDYEWIIHMLIKNKFIHWTYGAFEYDDLVNYGWIGVLKACRRYDPDKSIGFKQYVIYSVNEAIKISIWNYGSIIRQPVYLKRIGVRWPICLGPLWLEGMSTDADRDEIGDTDDVGRALDVLDARERDVIRRRFGIGQCAETLKQVGAHYRISKESIRKIESRAIAKMRRMFDDDA